MPGWVLNRLNAQQSENFTAFLLRVSSKLLKSIKCFFSNVNVKRSYFGLLVDKFPSLGTIKWLNMAQTEY